MLKEEDGNKKSTWKSRSVCTRNFDLSDSLYLRASHLVFEALLNWKADTVCYQLLGRMQSIYQQLKSWSHLLADLKWDGESAIFTCWER